MLKGLKVKITMRGVGKKGLNNQEWHIKIKYDDTTFKTAVKKDDFDEIFRKDFDEIFRKDLKLAFGKKNAKKIYKALCNMLEDC